MKFIIIYNYFKGNFRKLYLQSESRFSKIAQKKYLDKNTWFFVHKTPQRGWLFYPTVPRDVKVTSRPNVRARNHRSVILVVELSFDFYKLFFTLLVEHPLIFVHTSLHLDFKIKVKTLKKKMIKVNLKNVQPKSFRFLESPKSEILQFLLWSTRIFLAARSRWII